MNNKQNLRAKNVLLLVFLALCWGPSFFFIKIALNQWPPFTIVATRLSVAFIILYIIVKIQRRSIWQWRHLWYRFAIMGFFASALPFILITYSEQWISSSLAGIVNSSPPIFTAFLAHYFIETEKLTWRKVIGILTGIGGIVIVFLPALLTSQYSSIMGIVFVTIASLCYAIGMVFSRKYLMELPPLIGPTNQMLYSAIMTLPFAIFYDKCYLLPAPDMHTIFSMLGLVVLGTVMAFVLYYAIVKAVGATYLSTSTLLFPLVAIFCGMVFLKESLSFYSYMGCVFILSGLVVANKLFTWKDVIGLFGRRKGP